MRLQEWQYNPNYDKVLEIRKRTQKLIHNLNLVNTSITIESTKPITILRLPQP